jgi:type III secretory pathway component EscT
MKFVIRRAVAVLLLVPVVAGLYVAGYVVLGLLGAGMSITLDEVWANGLLIGFVCAVAFAFATQLDRLAYKIIGEEN